MNGLIACVLSAASTVSPGPAARGGAFRVTVALPFLVVSCVLVAVTVTLAGAGYGVLYRPLELMFPALRPLQDVQLTDHVTEPLKLPVPVTVAVNCCWVPIMAEPGETEMEVMDVVTGGGCWLLEPPPPPHAEIRRLEVQTRSAEKRPGYIMFPVLHLHKDTTHEPHSDGARQVQILKVVPSYILRWGERYHFRWRSGRAELDRAGFRMATWRRRPGSEEPAIA